MNFRITLQMNRKVLLGFCLEFIKFIDNLGRIDMFMLLRPLTHYSDLLLYPLIKL